MTDTDRPDWWIDGNVPAFRGAYAHAWEVGRRRRWWERRDPREAVHMASYLLFAPGAHPFWSWHVLSVISLADVPGVPLAKRRYPEAEYELIVLALDPQKPVPDPSDTKPGAFAAMQPPDAVVQFHLGAAGDDGAREMAGLAARAVVDGLLVPDTDHRESWRRSIKASAEHLRYGGHPEPDGPSI